MLIISAGMQKSGSGWFYNVINEMNIETNRKDARLIKSECGLQDLMKDSNNNIGVLYFAKLIKLWLLSLRKGTFVVKTHDPPGRAAKLLTKMGLVKIVYSYRDPRDALLSVMNHGEKMLSQGETKHPFTQLVNFDKALNTAVAWSRIWGQYAEVTGILMIKYESMMEDPTRTIKKMANYLGVDLSEDQVEKICWKFSKENPKIDNVNLHLNKAVTHRYRTEMNDEQLAKSRKALQGYLTNMGYSFD